MRLRQAPGVLASTGNSSRPTQAPLSSSSLSLPRSKHTQLRFYSRRYVIYGCNAFSLRANVTLPTVPNTEHLASQTSILSVKVRQYHPWSMPDMRNFKDTPHVSLPKTMMWSVLKFYANYSRRMPAHGIYLLSLRFCQSPSIKILNLYQTKVELVLHHLLK